MYSKMNTRTVAPGVILIALGALFFVVQLTDVGEQAVVAVIGGAFLVAYAFTRQYGFLVPGGIMTGLGLGIVLQNQGTLEEGGVVVIGLGAGFLSIYVIDLLVRGSSALWWPIIPGGILTAIGVLIETNQTEILAELQWAWPLVLIAIGVIVLLSQLLRRNAPPAATAPSDASALATTEPIERPEPRSLPSEPAPQHR
jgi:hypothetical protein